MEIKDYIIPETISILDAMHTINANGKGIVYICDDKVLRGVVTDGNIRRYILKNGNLEASISNVTNYEPKFLEQKTLVNVEQYMKEQNITSVPIVNENNEIIAIKFLNAKSAYSSTNLNIPVVIMAGGKGTRLQPYTQVLPKPLIPIGNKTITELIMSRFEEFGCRQFDMIVNYKKNLIKSFFSEPDNQHNVVFTDEEKFMGTGGGLKLIQGKYDSTFFMTNCDILIEDDYSEMLKYHKHYGNIITMVCASKSVMIPYGTVELSQQGKVEQLNEKPSFTFMANTGLYLIEPRFMDYIPEHTFIHITDIIERCISNGEKVGMYPISEHAWMDMGQIEELEKMQKRSK